MEVPVSDRVGEEGAGWAVAQATLASERGLTLVELTQRMRYALPLIGAAMRGAGSLRRPRYSPRSRPADCRVDGACALADRYLLRRITGDEAPGDASIVKLYYARTLREFTSLGLRIGGLDGQYHRGFMRGATQETGNWMVDFKFLQLVHCRRQ